MSPRNFSSFATVLALFGGSAGCRQVVGAGEFSFNDAAAKDVAVPYEVLGWQDPRCHACARRVCSAELAACGANDTCRAFDVCYGAHPIPAMRSNCSADVPDGALEYVELGRCVDLTCIDDCGGGESFACLGEPPVVPKSPKRDTFQLSVKYSDVFSAAPYPGLSVMACKKLGWSDPDCIDSKEAETTTDEAGNATLSLTYSNFGAKLPWDGYLRTSGPGTLPELRVSNFPLASDTFFDFSVMTQPEFGLLAARYQVNQLPGRGVITAVLFDCADFPALGVEAEIEPTDSQTRRFYSNGNLSLDELRSETGKDSYAIFANVIAGLVTIHVKVASTGARLADMQVLVRPGTRTAVIIEPKMDP